MRLILVLSHSGGQMDVYLDGQHVYGGPVGPHEIRLIDALGLKYELYDTGDNPYYPWKNAVGHSQMAPKSWADAEPMVQASLKLRWKATMVRYCEGMDKLLDDEKGRRLLDRGEFDKWCQSWAEKLGGLA